MKKLATAFALATFALTGTACDQYLHLQGDHIQVPPPSSCDDGGDAGQQPLCSPPKSPSGLLTAD